MNFPNTTSFRCFLCFILLNASTKIFAQLKNYPDSVNKYAIYVEDEIDKLDKSKLTTKLISKKIPLSELDEKKIKVNVYLSGNIFRKLEFPTFDESYTTGSKQTFYFDSVGKLICNSHEYSSELRHAIYAYPYVMIYSKTGSKIKHSIVVKDVEANYILATDKFIVDYYLSNFENIKYTTFDVSRNTSTILTTLTATDFRKNPSLQAILIKKLPKGSELQYLDRSPQQDSLLVGKERWIWLKVRDNKKQEGWIWGHPSIVKEYY